MTNKFLFLFFLIVSFLIAIPAEASPIRVYKDPSGVTHIVSTNTGATESSANGIERVREGDGTVRFSDNKGKKSVQDILKSQQPASQDFLVCKDSSGVTYINSNKNTSCKEMLSRKRVAYSRVKGFYFGKFTNKLNATAYREAIERASKKYGVSKELVRAVIHAESAFNPYARSSKGALGLMQLMPYNCRKYNVANPYNPDQNIDGGVHMLSDLIKTYKHDMRLVLAAYNAGEGAVAKYRGIPPYQETRQYVSRVISLLNRYRSAA